MEKGHKVILHTCRTHDIHEGHDCLAEAVQWCKDNGIELYAVNDNPYAREHWGNKKEQDTFVNKVYADIYIDDHSLFMPMVDGHVNWYKVFNYFKALHGKLYDPHDVETYLTQYMDTPTRDFIVDSHKQWIKNDGCLKGGMEFRYVVFNGDGRNFVDYDRYFEDIKSAERYFLEIITSGRPHGDVGITLGYETSEGMCGMFDDSAIYWFDETDTILGAGKCTIPNNDAQEGMLDDVCRQN